MKIGRVTLLDPVNIRDDKLGPEIEQQVTRIFEEKCEVIAVLVHNRDEAKAALLRLADEEKCPLIITTGGIGPGPHDIIPEATKDVIDRELPGFGETVRSFGFERGPIALLSRAIAGVRNKTLIVNLPSRPKAIQGCLKLLREAMMECMEQISGVRHALFVDPIEVPIEKWLPFLKRFRVKPDPRLKE